MTFNPVAAVATQTGGSCTSVLATRGRGAEGQPPFEPAAARHAPARSCASCRTSRAHVDEHGQREWALPDPERQSLHDARGRAQGDLGVGHTQSAPAGLGRRSGAAARAAPVRVQHRPHRVGNGPHHPQGCELRLSAARRHAADVPSKASVRSRRTTPFRSRSPTRSQRHRQADIPVVQYPHMAAERRRRDRRRVRLPRQRVPALRGKLVSATSRRAGSGTPNSPMCSQQTTATRRRWRRSRSSTRGFAASSKTPTTRAAARARRCPARPPSPAAAASTCGSPSTTLASSTS